LSSRYKLLLFNDFKEALHFSIEVLYEKAQVGKYVAQVDETNCTLCLIKNWRKSQSEKALIY